MKDVGYFPHDSNARNDLKTKAMIKKYGLEGYGFYWVIIEMLREDKGNKLQDKILVWNAIAEDCHCSVEKIKTFVKDCINEFELFIQEDGFFYSDSLIRRLAKLKYLRTMKQRGAYAMHEKLGHNITEEPDD